MAGSFGHCVDAAGNYRGTELLENMGDMAEAVEEMAFVILALRQSIGAEPIARALEEYHACCRRERPWPSFMASAAPSRTT